MKSSDPITLLKNIGSKRVEIFNSHGIYTLYDLLYYFPRRHLDRTSVKNIKDLIKGIKPIQDNHPKFNGWYEIPIKIPARAIWKKELLEDSFERAIERRKANIKNV